jgi:hypothetical protein
MPLRTKPYQAAFFVMLCVAVAALAQAPNKFPFKKQDMPFNAPAVERPIDRDCGAEGSAKSTNATERARQAQNRAKNQFGAQATPVPVRVTDFDRLEKATVRARKCAANNLSNCHRVDLTGGMPSDRGQLKDIATTAAGAKVGEGTVVVLEAKVLGSHYSNTKYNIYSNGRGSGESVNCKGVPDAAGASGIDRNDIHIELAAPGVTNHCLSVTAEISPHFRPDSWRRFHNMRSNGPGDNVNVEAKGVNFSKFKRVRLTGPLFYDASHEPCSPGHTNVSPKRRSLWEIHPVYEIEVQTTAGQWMSFEDWAAAQ